MTDSIHLVMTTSNADLIAMIADAIKTAIPLSTESGITIEPCTVNHPELSGIGVIMEWARRSAVIALQATGAHAAIGFAAGSAWVPYAKGARLARFPFSPIVGVAEDGVICWGLPDMYPRDFDFELRSACFRIFQEMTRSSADPRLQVATGIAVANWSNIDLGEVAWEFQCLD